MLTLFFYVIASVALTDLMTIGQLPFLQALYFASWALRWSRHFSEPDISKALITNLKQLRLRHYKIKNKIMKAALILLAITSLSVA